jgi:hypothetical protein
MNALARSPLRAVNSQCTILRTRAIQSRRHIQQSSLPTIAQPSFWTSLIPKPFRREKLAHEAAALQKKTKSKDWNPATFFIWMFILIGSQAMHMVAAKKQFGDFVRQSDVRITLLREVVEKLQKGQDVDVEKVLGTGNPNMEQEWENSMNPLNLSLRQAMATHFRSATGDHP